jgi:PAS domain S-box-containing protein
MQIQATMDKCIDEQETYLEEQLTLRLQHWASVAALIGVVLWPLFGLADYFGKEHVFKEFLPLRVGMASLSFLLYLLTRFKRTRWYLNAVCYTGMLASAALNEYMTIRTGGHIAPYYAGMIPIMIVAVALLPMRVLASVLLGVLIYLTYVVPILLLDRIQDLSIFILFNLFLLSVLFITVVIRIVSNKSMVNELMLQHSLTSEKNLLDRLVQERTADLNKSEQWHRSIFENSTDGLLILTKDGVITNANDMACKIYNLNREKIIGSRVADLFCKKNRDDIAAVLTKMLLVKSIVFEMPYIGENSKNIFLELSVQDIPISEEHYTLMVSRDITDKKMLQVHLSQTQKMESIATFAGGIAHDVRNIITSMIAYIEIVRNDKGVSERTLQRTVLLDKSIRNAGAMISQLLNFARKSKTTLVETGLNGIVRDTLNIIRASIGENIEIVHDLWPNDPIIRANVNQIETVIMNLVFNARDAMPEGGRIDISSEIEAITGKEDGIVPEGRYVVMTISDTGIGIPVDTQRSIFEPFFTTKTEGKGTGLGLAMVYSIVTDHKGHIKVESEPGRGSKFRILFPLLAERRFPEKKVVFPQESYVGIASDDRPLVEKTGAILFVDDDETLITLMSDALQARGYEVISTTSPEEAVGMFQKEADNIALLITDMAMSRMDGAELIRRVRAIKPGIKVLVISAFNHEKVELMLNGINASERLHKPFAPSEFVAAVRTALRSDREIGDRESPAAI